jgi:hypothetical protein
LSALRLRACRKRPGRSQQDQLDLREQLYRISGVDLTRIDGISLQTAQKVFFEIGTDVSAWSNEKKFACWLGLRLGMILLPKTGSFGQGCHLKQPTLYRPKAVQKLKTFQALTISEIQPVFMGRRRTIF